VLGRPLPDSSRGLKFDTTGAVLWDSSGVAFVGEYHGSGSYVAAPDSKGGMIITWDSFWDGYVYVQRIYPNGKVGGDTTTVVEDYVESSHPLKFELLQNFPNPFNSKTTISFHIPIDHSDFTLKILNIRGQEVKRLYAGNLKKGYQTVAWDGKDRNGRQVSSGIYFYSITYRSNTQVKRMVLLK